MFGLFGNKGKRIEQRKKEADDAFKQLTTRSAQTNVSTTIAPTSSATKNPCEDKTSIDIDDSFNDDLYHNYKEIDKIDYSILKNDIYEFDSFGIDEKKDRAIIEKEYKDSYNIFVELCKTEKKFLRDSHTKMESNLLLSDLYNTHLKNFNKIFLIYKSNFNCSTNTHPRLENYKTYILYRLLIKYILYKFQKIFIGALNSIFDKNKYLDIVNQIKELKFNDNFQDIKLIINNMFKNNIEKKFGLLTKNSNEFIASIDSKKIQGFIENYVTNNDIFCDKIKDIFKIDIINNYLLEIINAKNIIDFTYINSELIEFKIDNNELSVIKKPKDIYNDINFEKIDELKETDLIYKKTIKIFDKYNYSTKKEDVENIYTKYYEILLGNKQKILELQELNNLISSIKTQFYGIDVCYDDYLYKLKKSNFLNIIFNTYCVENKDPTSLDVKEFQENLDKKVNKDMIITYIYSNYYYDIYLNIILSLIQNTILTNIINIIKNLIIFHRSQMKICLPINVIKQLKTTDEIKDKADNINDSILIIVKLLHDIKKTDIPDYIKNKITDNKDVIKYIQIIFNEYINKNLNLNNSNIKIIKMIDEIYYAAVDFLIELSPENDKNIIYNTYKNQFKIPAVSLSKKGGNKKGKLSTIKKTKERVAVYYDDIKYKRNVLIKKNKRYVKINNKLIRI